MRSLSRGLSAGFDVETFGSGTDFLQWLKSRRPACLVLGLHMPRMSGFDLQEHLVSVADPVPIVIITSRWMLRH